MKIHINRESRKVTIYCKNKPVETLTMENFVEEINEAVEKIARSHRY